MNDIKRDDVSWKQKLGYIFGTPGWSHDGSRLTSKALRVEESASENAAKDNLASVNQQIPPVALYNTKDGPDF